VPETIEVPECSYRQAQAALFAVEQCSFDTATDLTVAGYGVWTPLLHDPREPLGKDKGFG
jgi:hypothetical protein